MTSDIFMTSRLRAIPLWASVLSLAWVIGKEANLIEPFGNEPLTIALMCTLAMNSFVMACAYCKAKFLPLVSIYDNELVFARPFFKTQSINLQNHDINAKIVDDKISFLQANKTILKFSLFGISNEDKMRVKAVVQANFSPPLVSV